MEENKTQGLIGEDVKRLPVGQLLMRIGPGLICLAIAMAICYSYDGSPTQLILIANIATSIATPIGGLFVLLLIWRKDVNKGFKAPTLLRICMTISYIFVLVMTVSAFQKPIIPGIAKLFAGA